MRFKFGSKCKYEPIMTVRLFIKPYCPWCHKAQHWLDKHLQTA